MVSFIARRFLASVVVLLVATFLVYVLVDFAIDPLEHLRTSTSPEAPAQMAALTAQLQLDVPSPLRYLDWLSGVGGCVIGQCDLGVAWQTGQEVTTMLGSAVVVTLRLVFLATVLAIIFGVAVGIVSALRQYTGFDYGIIFLSFLLYSLPTFWVAVLLKQWGAIGFNDFLADPRFGPPVVAVVSAVVGVVWAAALGGEWRRRLVVFASAAGVTAAIMVFISTTGWLLDPGLGILGVALLGVGTAVVVTLLSTGLRNKRALYSALTTALLGAALWYPMQQVFNSSLATTPMMLGLAVVAAGAGWLVGFLFGGPDRGLSGRGGAITAVIMGLLLFVDRLMQAWRPYSESSVIRGRPIATIGSETPNLSGSYWIMQLDVFTHLVLPTISLVLISFAAYTRYSRASMLEVLNQDYVRTARAKGLTERTVVMRHAFRNTLIPLATLIPLDFAGILGGAIITERIFGWRGMGTMFLNGLDTNQIDPVMAYVLITGAVAIIANFVADLLYAVLDPRIRVHA